MDVTKVFGINSFNDKVMKERLPNDTYKALKKTVDSGEPLAPEVADIVASAMKDWAIEKGATHYTHWFQPLTGSTAEKHDSFIEPADDGSVIMKFSGKQLIQGEPDASSFPNGGLRATFEARGYTAWDATSPTFLKEDSAGDVTLCIPTAFCSYTSEALDKKTPLLRSMKVVSEQALRVLRVLGNTTATRVTSTVGAEQEYFLIDREYYEKRLDLIATGRTLFGAPSPKGQELDDHYFGAIKDRVADFMKELDLELWKLGITSKTKHNEVAPSQFEMAPIFSTTNISTDHNQLTMETMQKVALRHDLVCLLHEKPYAGVNGSGKHNNWSLSANDGQNLLEPGSTPAENEQFLIFLAALIQSVDKHADLLRAAAANSGNDHRLGANEAPPAIISIFMGTELTEILENIARGKANTNKDKSFITVGVDTLPALPKDNTDRNRTSPFAFTGNKFEFRMVASSASISGPNVVINTIVAEALDEFATRLEKASDINAEAQAIVKDVMEKHGRIIFNGNGYSAEWVEEAARRGLPNVAATVEALKAYTTEKASTLFESYGVLSPEELKSRYEIYLEQYIMQINIEALTAIDMVKKQYLPVIMEQTNFLAESIAKLKAVGASFVVQEKLLTKISGLLEAADKKLSILEANLETAQAMTDLEAQGVAYREKVFMAMTALREDIDALEFMIDVELWPVPSYAQMLFNL